MESKNKNADLSSSDGINVPQSANGESGAGELEKIRSILFGEQIRSTEDRLANLEKQLLAKMNKAHKAIEARLDALEESLSDRTKDLAELQNDVKEQKQEIEADLKTMDASLREAIDSTASTASEDMEAKTDAMSQAFESSLGRMEKEKVNRGQLSDLLSQLAQSLEK